MTEERGCQMTARGEGMSHDRARGEGMSHDRARGEGMSHEREESRAPADDRRMQRSVHESSKDGEEDMEKVFWDSNQDHDKASNLRALPGVNNKPKD